MQQVEVATYFWPRSLRRAEKIKLLNMYFMRDARARQSGSARRAAREHRSIDKSIPTRDLILPYFPVPPRQTHQFVSFESLFNIRYSGIRSWTESQVFNLSYMFAHGSVSGDYTRDIGHRGISLRSSVDGHKLPPIKIAISAINLRKKTRALTHRSYRRLSASFSVRQPPFLPSFLPSP